LLQIPGIGPRSADLLLRARRQNRLHSLKDLEFMGIQTKKALGFILINGRRPDQQLALW
jgi:predicted DNA-binding helix-hairpin-helix protein